MILTPTKATNNIFVIDLNDDDDRKRRLELTNGHSKKLQRRSSEDSSDAKYTTLQWKQLEPAAQTTFKGRRSFTSHHHDITRASIRPKEGRRLRPSLPFLLAFSGIIYPALFCYLHGKIPEEDNEHVMPSGGRSINSSGKDYEVVTTNYGWNGPDPHSHARRIITGEFFNATLKHPRYNATAWADLERNPDPNRRIVAFLDVDTCLELNYPIYGGRDWWKNVEEGYRNGNHSYQAVVKECCPYIERARSSPALLANPDSRLVLLDCSGSNKLFLRSGRACNHGAALYDNEQVITAYLSAKEMRPWDVGLPPPAIKPVTLTPYERFQVKECEARKYLFSFQGQAKHYFGRNELLKFQHHDDMFIKFRHQEKYLKDIRLDGGDAYNYGGILKESHFGAAPRGDNLFSYRFSEILSAGAIPVVYADGWKPPFNEKVVNWAECAVFIPESDYNKTREILLAIPDDVRCRMQQRALEVWSKYVSSRAGWVRGLVESAIL